MRNSMILLAILWSVTQLASCTTLTPEEEQEAYKHIKTPGGMNCNTTAGSVTQCTKW